MNWSRPRRLLILILYVGINYNIVKNGWVRFTTIPKQQATDDNNRPLTNMSTLSRLDIETGILRNFIKLHILYTRRQSPPFEGDNNQRSKSHENWYDPNITQRHLYHSMMKCTLTVTQNNANSDDETTRRLVQHKHRKKYELFSQFYTFDTFQHSEEPFASTSNKTLYIYDPINRRT